ncbi:M20/M25/M40 family metallo-hydrolase [Candidatus Bathyarchaeota archaeon]|nr:M20/M25/M40 family metallo-hydrolase [Candidatus Bathyarchaeota archaeon]
MMNTLSLLETLVKIESPSGKEEKLSRFILNYLSKLGYDAFIEHSNVLVSPEKKFIVATHLDTFRVLAPFSFDGKYAYGTGVCDAKASIAAILLALEKINELNFGIAFFYDEENEGRGSKEFCANYNPKMAIVMEPTYLKIANVQHGGLEARIRVRGLAAHGSTPEKGENAIEKSIRMINRLMKIENARVSVQYIKGGNMEYYVIPEEAEMRIEFTFKPNVKAESILREIKRMCSNAELELTVKEMHNGFVSDKVTKLLANALQKSGLEIRFFEMPSWTDAINLHYLAGCDAVTFGPGELHLCHTKNERIKLKDIDLAAKVLVALNDLLEN